MNSHVPVTVLMSVWNGEEFVEEAVDSILAQTFGDFEFLIVDDCSDDGTPRVLADAAVRDARIRVVRNDKNLGLTRSLNRGLALARGQYVARIDADDYAYPSRLEKQIAFMKSHDEIGVSGAEMELVDAQGRLRGRHGMPRTHDLIALWLACGHNPIAHPAAFMRLALVRQVGGYDASLPRAQDYDLWCRLLGVTRFANLPDVLVRFGYHDNRISALHAAEQIACGKRALSRLMDKLLGRRLEADMLSALLDFAGNEALPLTVPMDAVLPVVREIAAQLLSQKIVSTEGTREIEAYIEHRATVERPVPPSADSPPVKQPNKLALFLERFFGTRTH